VTSLYQKDHLRIIVRNFFCKGFDVANYKPMHLHMILERKQPKLMALFAQCLVIIY